MDTALPLLDGRYAREVAFLLDCLRASWRLLHAAGRPTAAGRHHKADNSPVTALDFSVQALILSRLTEAFPGEAFVAEEDGRQLPEQFDGVWIDQATRAVRLSNPEAGPEDVRRWLNLPMSAGDGRYWTIDPIDGTRGLLRGGQYATAVALVEDGRVVLGGLACPSFDVFGADGCLCLAVRQAGAWVAEAPDGVWRRLSVAGEGEVGGRRLIRSVESSPPSDRRLTSIRRELDLGEEPLRMDSQVKYLALAGGHGALVVRLPRKGGRQSENTWDHAAGTLLAEEAGATVSDVRGDPLDFGVGARLERNLGVVASLPSLHAKATVAVQRALDSQGATLR